MRHRVRLEMLNIVGVIANARYVGRSGTLNINGTGASARYAGKPAMCSTIL